MCQMCSWAAVLKDLKERYFCREGREEPFEVSEGEMCEQYNISPSWRLSQSTSIWAGGEAGVRGTGGKDGWSDGNWLTHATAEITLED